MLTYRQWREQATGTPFPADQCEACGQQLAEGGSCRRCARRRRGRRNAQGAILRPSAPPGGNPSQVDVKETTGGTLADLW